MPTRAQGRRLEAAATPSLWSGTKPASATGRWAGKARGVERSESQETCPDALTKPVFAGGSGQVVSVFVLGGARSGKSRLAVTGLPHRGRIVFVATAAAHDAEMARRIERHRAERPPHWRTVEEPLDLVARLHQLEGTCDGVIIDCLTLWVSNRLLRGDSDDAVLDEASTLARLIGRRPSSFTLVSNEVGAGVHPETALGLRFRDVLGGVNQRIAAACDTVVLMVAGLPLTVKSAATNLRPSDDSTVQAP